MVAQIRGLLEYGWSEIALFFRADRNPGLPKQVIFGAVNRVRDVCSKNPMTPELSVACLASTAQSAGKRNQHDAFETNLSTSKTPQEFTKPTTVDL